MFCRQKRRVEPDEWIAERSESDKMRKAQASNSYALIANNKMYLLRAPRKIDAALDRGLV